MVKCKYCEKDQKYGYKLRNDLVVPVCEDCANNLDNVRFCNAMVRANWMNGTSSQKENLYHGDLP